MSEWGGVVLRPAPRCKFRGAFRTPAAESSYRRRGLDDRSEKRVSRALNINATQAHVIAACGKRNIPISAIEALHSGGTRVVMVNAADTATIAKLYGSKVIAGPVQRMPLRVNVR